MKIVQSLWSKPSYKNQRFNISDRNNGGWENRKHHFMSWALSCLQFRKFYPEVELVTDQLGYDLLINQLELPYTSIKVVLDQLNDYQYDLWSLGKLHAYSIQDKPFIHADGDVFIWEKFSSRITQAQLLAQNLESGFNTYNYIFEGVQQHFKFIPPVLLKSIENNGGILGVNAGIIGGYDTGFFKDFAAIAKDFVDRNYKALEKIDVGVFNIVFEQFLFHALAEEKKYKIEYLLDNVNDRYDGLVEFTGVPTQVKYVHVLSTYKRQSLSTNLLEYRLQQDHPKYYYKILNLLRTSKI